MSAVLKPSSPSSLSGEVPAGAPAGAPVFSPLTEKCALATKVAFESGDAAERALYAAEYALDEVTRLERQLAAAKKQLSDATKALRGWQRDLGRMNVAFIERMIPAMPAEHRAELRAIAAAESAAAK